MVSSQPSVSVRSEAVYSEGTAGSTLLGAIARKLLKQIDMTEPPISCRKWRRAQGVVEWMSRSIRENQRKFKYGKTEFTLSIV